MLDLVRLYRDWKPGNVLEKYLPALERVNGTPSHDGLDPNFQNDWQAAAQDGTFQGAQEHERDRVYFNPAVNRAKQDGVQALGQFAYYDAIVMHGDDWGDTDFSSIRQRALNTGARPPAQGGDERAWLHAFLDARVWAMKQEPAHEDDQPGRHRAAPVPRRGQAQPRTPAAVARLRAVASTIRLTVDRNGLAAGTFVVEAEPKPFTPPVCLIAPDRPIVRYPN